MSYAEDDYLLISGIQHFMFCRRQWALIHIEQQWQENRLTVEGKVIHRNAHKDDFIEKRPGILVTRGLRVSSPTLKITGQCDVVEFLSSEEGVPLHGHRGLWQAVPVEYKRGKDKKDDSEIEISDGDIPLYDEVVKSLEFSELNTENESAKVPRRVELGPEPEKTQEKVLVEDDKK